MTELLAGAPWVGMRESLYTGEHIVSYTQNEIRQYWYDWADRANVQAIDHGGGRWSVSVSWPDVPWQSSQQPDGSVLLSRIVPDLTRPEQFVEEMSIVPPPVVPTALPLPDRGRKVKLPELDAEELSTLLAALDVYAFETGRYEHNVAYLGRVLRRAIKESEGSPDA